MYRIIYLLLAFCKISALHYTDYTLTDLTIGKKHHIYPTDLSAYHIQMNYKPLFISLQSDLPLLSLTLSTTAWDGKGDISNICESSADYCISLQDGSMNSTISSCIDELWIYIDPLQNTEITVLLSYIPDRTCDPIPEDIYSICGSMDYSSCNTCGNNCRIGECIGIDKYNYSRYTVLSLCVPFTTTKEELNGRCLAHKDVEYSQWKRDCKEELFIDEISWKNVVLVMAVVIVYVSALVLVTFYHCFYKQKGRAPVKCCRWCPKVLFPDEERLIKQEEYKQQLDMEMGRI